MLKSDCRPIGEVHPSSKLVAYLAPLLATVLALLLAQPTIGAAQQTPPPPPPPLSKEYIYLGGRLIATEEGKTGDIIPASLPPTITGLSRTPPAAGAANSAVPGESFVLTLMGTNLFTDGIVSFAPSAGITLGTVTYPNPDITFSQLSVPVSVSASAAQGEYLITVKNSGGSASTPFVIGESQTMPTTIAFHGFTSLLAGGPPAEVTLDWVSGVQFNSGSTVWINGSFYSNPEPGKVSATQMSFILQAATTALPRVLDISVQTPLSGSAVEISNTLSFTVRSPNGPDNPFPVIDGSSLNPTSMAVGSGGTVSVSSLAGSFNQNSLLLINGIAHFVPPTSGQTLSTTLTAADVPHAGSLNITVFNPHPGGCALFTSDPSIPLCGFALNQLSLRITATPPGPGPYSILLSGNAFAKVAPDGFSTSLNITGPLTVEAWVFPAALGTRQAIAERYDATPGENRGGYGLRLNGDGTVSFSTYQNSADFDTVTSGTPVSLGAWTHVAGVFDGSQLRIYVGGQLANSSNCSGSCRAPRQAPAQPLLMGASPDRGPDGSQGFFVGNLDEVRVSAGAVYTGPSFTPVINLPPSGIGLWKFDDQTLNDSSGNQHDAIGKGGSIQFSNNVPGFTGTVVLQGETGGGNLPTVGQLSLGYVNPGDPTFTLIVSGTALSGNISLATPLQSSPLTGIIVGPTSVDQIHHLQASASVTIGPLAEPGAYPVSVGGSDTPLVLIVKPVQPAPVPSLAAASLNPVSDPVGTTPPPTIVITGGTGFIQGSRIRFNGGARATNFISGSSLSATLLQSDLETRGTFPITVYNPPSTALPPNAGGGESATSLTFTVTGPGDNLAPSLTQLCVGTTCSATSTTVQNGAAVTLRVLGSNFVSGASQIVFRGRPLTNTLFINAGELDVNLSSADTANSGAPLAAPVAVNTQPPGGGISPTTLPLTITGNNPIPTVTNLTVNGLPPNVSAGGPGFTLQVIGTGFVGTVGQPPVSIVYVNQAPRAATTVFKSSTELDVTITSTDIQTPTQLELSVFTPGPGGGSSDPMLLTVSPASNPKPVLSALSITQMQVDSTNPQGQPLTVTGTGFMSGSRLLVNGSPLVTTFNSADPTHLSTSLPDSDFAVLGQLAVTVSNPEPGGGTSNVLNIAVFAPAPRLSSVAPTSASVGFNPVPITLTGTNFIDESSVLVNGSSRQASVVSGSGGTQLTSALTPADIANGTLLSITVSNPTNPPGGGTSAVVTFTVNNPQPALDPTTPLTPASVLAGSGAQTISVLGTGFDPSSRVTINNQQRATFVDPTHLNVALLATEVAAGGTISITVVNPPPGGGTSATANFIVNNPVPTLDPVNPLTPSVVIVGSGSQTITVLGIGFLTTSTVTINGSNRAAFVDATHLNVNLLSSEVAAGVPIPITVVNPGPGGGASAPVNVTMNNPVPTVAGLSRITATTGDAPFQITVLGTEFVGTSIAQLGGGAIHTRLPGSDSNDLIIQLTQSDLSVHGVFTVTVTNPAPGGGTSTSTSVTFSVVDPPPNPPVVTRVSPSSATIGQTPPAVTVTGQNFVVPGSLVMINGAAHTPAANSTTTQLFIQLSLEDLNASNQVYPVTVITPAGAVSAINSPATDFTLNNPVPLPQSVTPPSVLAGIGQQTLTIQGTGFVPGSAVMVNGQNQNRGIYIDSNHIQVSLLASETALASQMQMTVVNSAPGGGSAPIVFNVNNPMPAISTLQPSSVTAGSGAFTLTVNGTGFVQSSVVHVNGNIRTTTFVSATKLTAAIPASDVASAGTLSITVSNPGPGGGTSSAVTLTVNAASNPKPSISSITPSNVFSGGATFTLTINGSGFVSSSVVNVGAGNNFGPRTTTFVSPTQLTVQITSSDIATSGMNVNVSVTNPTPGGGTSNQMTVNVQ